MAKATRPSAFSKQYKTAHKSAPKYTPQNQNKLRRTQAKKGISLPTRAQAEQYRKERSNYERRARALMKETGQTRETLVRNNRLLPKMAVNPNEFTEQGIKQATKQLRATKTTQYKRYVREQYVVSVQNALKNLPWEIIGKEFYADIQPMIIAIGERGIMYDASESLAEIIGIAKEISASETNPYTVDMDMTEAKLWDIYERLGELQPEYYQRG